MAARGAGAAAAVRRVLTPYVADDREGQAMKRITIIVCGLVSLAASAHAAPVLKLEKIKQIVCEATAHYEEDTPNKKTPARGVKVFTRGSRKDLKPRPGAFLLAEFESADDGGLKVSDNQQFYFSPVKGGKLSFDFIANWKAHGELVLGAEGTATGFINQKTHITELSCAILAR